RLSSSVPVTRLVITSDLDILLVLAIYRTSIQGLDLHFLVVGVVLPRRFDLRLFRRKPLDNLLRRGSSRRLIHQRSHGRTRAAHQPPHREQRQSAGPYSFH